MIVDSLVTTEGINTIDHIIPASRGGEHQPCNYFLMPIDVNAYFGNNWTAEKVAYIGHEAAVEAWLRLTMRTAPGIPKRRK
jgi:hypothetical protein